MKAEYIKQCVSPRDFYQYELGLTIKKHGWVDGGLCPFHSDNHSGSFRINTDTGSFKCFSCGHGGGDVLAFTRLLYDMKFTEALEKLEYDWGVT